MTPFLNCFTNILFSENERIIDFILIPACFIESAFLYILTMSFLKIKLSKKDNFWYTVHFSVIGVILNILIPEPFNTVLYYICIWILLKVLLHVSLPKGFFAIIFSLFIIALINMLIIKPYQLLLHISNYETASIPIYRLGYLTIFYILLALSNILVKKIMKTDFSLELLDSLDKQSLRIIYHYISFTFLSLVFELILTAFYIDKIPILVASFNFCLIFSLFVLSVYTLSRVSNLEATKKSLQCAKEYNKSLTILYDEVKGFNHDFKNIISAIDGYVATNNLTDLKKYINEVKDDCKITNNLSILNPRIINDPGIYSILNNKYFKATNAGIKFELEFFLDLNTVKVNKYKFSRIIGILLDNAIEEAEKCDEKIIKVSFRREERNHRAIIKIENTYTNKNVDIDKIFKKGFSGKENHSGIGLWEVRKYVKNRKNSDLFTSKNDKFFSQELTIYDTI